MIKNNKLLEEKINNTIVALQQGPFYSSLRTHKVYTRLHGAKYSSRVTGDIRVIWDFDSENNLTLILFDLGGHSGKDRVYQ